MADKRDTPSGRRSLGSGADGARRPRPGGSGRFRASGGPGGVAARGDQVAAEGGFSARGGISGAEANLRVGQRLVPKGPRVPEPELPEDVTGQELDRGVHQQLRTLSKENAEGVARHLVMVAACLAADDLEAAQAHANTVLRRAGRVPAAREAVGLVAYRRGDFAKALAEFRTVRRLSGSSHLLALMVDCERGLGRLDRALDLALSAERLTLGTAERVELAIATAGVRRDLGQADAALVELKVPQLRSAGWPRLHYAYADLLAFLGRGEEARTWFRRVVQEDIELETDAVERLEELDGIAIVDVEIEVQTEGERDGGE